MLLLYVKKEKNKNFMQFIEKKYKKTDSIIQEINFFDYPSLPKKKFLKYPWTIPLCKPIVCLQGNSVLIKIILIL